MSNPKFKVGQRIKVNYGVSGHIVLILNPFDDKKRIYYCSMYPGALSKYEYIFCVDLNSCQIDNDGKIDTLQALNSFKEEELETDNSD